MPNVTQMERLAKIFISIKKGSLKKILWESRLWVGKRKESILGYVPKNYEKKIQAVEG